jgi:hypothetical protein
VLTQAEQAKQVPALDLMCSMMRGLPVDGYEITKADKKEVYRDAFFSMKLVPFDKFGQRTRIWETSHVPEKTVRILISRRP